jgi:hypothetical protein
MHTSLTYLILTYLLANAAAAPGAMPAQAAHAASVTNPAPAAVLVELFTSEGCSSCPPADALLRQINGTRTAAGQLIVGISEHVTYWNGLGWSDPYASESCTARQNAYGERFGLESVYTPQIIINGSEQIVGSDRAALLRALQKESEPRPGIDLRILSATAVGSMLKVSFSVGKPAAAQGAEIMAVLTDDADRSSVLRGENSGHTLTHVAVARALARVATIRGSAAERTIELPLPSSFHPELGGHHVILFAQAAHLGAVLGVDAQPL